MTAIQSASGNLTHADFDEDQSVMTIRFSGGAEYAYERFPESLWNQFQATFGTEDVSTGRFFNDRIKPNYNGVKVAENNKDKAPSSNRSRRIPANSRRTR